MKSTILFKDMLVNSLRFVLYSGNGKTRVFDFIQSSGLVWEVKCPFVNKRDRIAVLFRHATRQSENVIFDLRNLKTTDKQVILHLQKLFKVSRRVRKLIIICKNGELKTFKKS